MSDRARQLVDAHEGSVAPDDRRARGVHYTPSPLADLLVARAFDHLGRTPTRVCDPACGSGAFLLAAAAELHRRGVPVREVVTSRLVGIELDAGAADVARRALVVWADDLGAAVAAHEVHVEHGDALAAPGTPAAVERPAGIDVVVGNPPFLNQLGGRTARGTAHRATAERLLGRPGGYADTASLFLVASLDLLDGDGVVCLLQPQSFLSTRDTEPVRAAVAARAELVELWGSDDAHFDASVRVCAPVLAAPRAAAGDAPPVRISWGLPGVEHPDVGPTPDARTWGPLLAGPRGLPVVPEPDGPRLGDVATATAGFRDEFYALTDALADGLADGSPVQGAARLVTVGMIDVARLTWGTTPRRVRGAARLAPTVDLDDLARRSPRVASWSRDRLIPKVLVATQTRVVEAVPDPVGDCIPVTPTISVEPTAGAPSLFHLTAALSAPPVAAVAAARHLGAGLSAGALRWSATSVLDVALPSPGPEWDEGAELVESLMASSDAERPALLDRLGVVMTEAHGLDDAHPVLAWWRSLAR